MDRFARSRQGPGRDLLARREDVERSQWDPGAHKQKQAGTLVYRGVAYDHILYSNRGQGSAHIAGKNKWGLKFNNGHEVPFQDHDGIAFPAPLDGLNLNPGGSTPYLPVHRGISGMDEVVSMRAYRLGGVPSPPATWIQWRVVTDVEEAPKDPYRGDLWGLYVALGEMEPELLADRPFPEGLVVSSQSGLKDVPKGMEEPQKVWEAFLNGMRSNPPVDWWRKNRGAPRSQDQSPREHPPLFRIGYRPALNNGLSLCPPSPRDARSALGAGKGRTSFRDSFQSRLASSGVRYPRLE